MNLHNLASPAAAMSTLPFAEKYAQAGAPARGCDAPYLARNTHSGERYLQETIEMSHHCTNPACPHALVGSYIVWYAGEGRDLRALLLDRGISPKVVKSMVLEAKEDEVVFTVIDARCGVVAMQEDNDQWSVWHLRMHQSFDDEVGAQTFGRATDAAFEARGKRPPRWTVLTFPGE